MIKLTTSKGLGDAIYLRAVVLHLLERHPDEDIIVYSVWNDVFADLPVKVKSLSDKIGDVRAVAYRGSLPLPCDEDDEFTVRCKAAGITEPVDLKLGWKVKNHDLLYRIRRDAAGRQIFIYQPFKLITSLAMELMRPRRESFHRFLVDHSDYYRIKLGHPPFVEADVEMPCELDLFGKGFIFDTFDVCTIGDLFFGETCFLIQMAETLDRKFVCMFGSRALAADHWISDFTPKRVFHKKHLGTAIDDDFRVVDADYVPNREVQAAC